jgi:2,4-dienoyl-CoA reductase-like NADH-dependent reductase (Old Yellow Enzyme family)
MKKTNKRASRIDKDMVMEICVYDSFNEAYQNTPHLNKNWSINGARKALSRTMKTGGIVWPMKWGKGRKKTEFAPAKNNYIAPSDIILKASREALISSVSQGELRKETIDFLNKHYGEQT